ncbi:MAG: hypothetical protein AAF960_17380 [Bacteroidota bacterium]
MLQFDKHGLITPKEIIELSLVDFERIFVTERQERNHRQRIFDEYIRHNDRIRKEIGPILFQFVNGSFTTLKDKPKDIDVATFIDYQVYRRNEQAALDYMKDCKKVKEVDGFIVYRSYPGHPYFMQAQFSYDYWQDLFTLTRKNEEGKRFRKGLVKIQFNE